MQKPLILASASPRRAALLKQLGVTFSVQPSDIDESPRHQEPPVEQAERLAREKAAVGLSRALPGQGDVTVLASDTLISLNGTSLGKPEDFAHFKEMIGALAGTYHDVITSVCVKNAVMERHVNVCTRVWFSELSLQDMVAYWQTDEPCDKAGGYAIQGIGGQFVKRIEGSVSAVIGLPLYETKQLLREAGVIA